MLCSLINYQDILTSRFSFFSVLFSIGSDFKQPADLLICETKVLIDHEIEFFGMNVFDMIDFFSVWTSKHLQSD